MPKLELKHYRKSFLVIYREEGRELLMRQYGASVEDGVRPLEKAGLDIVVIVVDKK